MMPQQRSPRLAAIALVLGLTAGMCVAVLIDDANPPAGTPEAAASAAPGTDELGDLLTTPPFPLLAPGWLPHGMHLASATLEPADTATASCPRVALRWTDGAAVIAADESGDSDPEYPPELSLELSPAKCASAATTQDRGEPFRAGAHRARIVRPAATADEPWAEVHLTVGLTRATVVSDLPEAQIARVVGQLKPYSGTR